MFLIAEINCQCSTLCFTLTNNLVELIVCVCGGGGGARGGAGGGGARVTLKSIQNRKLYMHKGLVQISTPPPPPIHT